MGNIAIKGNIIEPDYISYFLLLIKLANCISVFGKQAIGMRFLGK